MSLRISKKTIGTGPIWAQVDEPWRARISQTSKPRHAAPGAFELPMERLKELPWRPELVVGVAQEELNRRAMLG